MFLLTALCAMISCLLTFLSMTMPLSTYVYLLIAGLSELMRDVDISLYMNRRYYVLWYIYLHGPCLSLPVPSMCPFSAAIRLSIIEASLRSWVKRARVGREASTDRGATTVREAMYRGDDDHCTWKRPGRQLQMFGIPSRCQN